MNAYTSDLPIPAVRLGKPVVEDYAYLAKRMRPDEIAQHCALRGLPVDAYDPDKLARVLAQQDGPGFTLVDRNGYPICCGGFDYLRPGVYECWAIGTLDGWRDYWRPITRHARTLMDELLAADAHRIQTVALITRTAAIDWYERGLGMRREGVLRGFFSDWSDGVMLSKTRAD